MLIVNPNPVPPNLRVVDESACLNGKNILSSSSFDIPIPVSMISIRTWPSCNHCGRMVTPPATVNFMPLPTILIRTCFSFSISVSTSGRLAGRSRERSIFLASAWVWSISTTSKSSGESCIERITMSILPASIFERSSMSLIKPSRCFPLRLIFSEKFNSFFPSTSPVFFRSMPEKPIMEFSGVLSSWLILATNSLRCRSASINSSLASSSFFACCCTCI